MASETAAKEKGTNIQSAASAAFGTPQTKIENPKRKDYLTACVGNLTIKFEKIEWLVDKNDSTLGYQPAEFKLFAKAVGASNYKGYPLEIPIGDKVEAWRQFAKAASDIADFIEQTELDLSKDSFYKNEIGEAYADVDPNSSSSKK
jgi:hypothetical protein